jgi:ammonium transporter Rh
MRSVVNTVLSLTGSTIGAFAASSLFNNGRFRMQDVLKSTLAGGVIIGATADMLYMPWQPILLGFLGGVFSSSGLNQKLPGFLSSSLAHDTCGVLFLHGIPGVLGGLASIFMAGFLKKEDFLLAMSNAQ